MIINSSPAVSVRTSTRPPPGSCRRRLRLFSTVEGTSVNQESLKEIRREESSGIRFMGRSRADRKAERLKKRTRGINGRITPELYIFSVYIGKFEGRIK
jgi:hypothetical protein